MAHDEGNKVSARERPISVCHASPHLSTGSFVNPSKSSVSLASDLCHMMRTIDLVNDCDSFPYTQSIADTGTQSSGKYYRLQVATEKTTLGLVLPHIANAFRQFEHWNVDDEALILELRAGRTSSERSAAVAETLAVIRDSGIFKALKGWRDELFPVFGHSGELLFVVERAASQLLGVATYGIHMTCYVRKPFEQTAKGRTELVDREGTFLIWVARRAQSKQTYGGMLDNTIGGGISIGESPVQALIRESSEEGSLPEELIRQKAKAAGTVTYCHVSDERSGGETGLVQPEIQYVFDLELDAQTVPHPDQHDEEVERFRLMTVPQVKDALSNGEFKPNCALVMLDFFIRHGILTVENEEDYLEIVPRLHRRLDVPIAKDTVK